MTKTASRARREFRTVYGNQTVNIVRDIASGRKARDIARSLRTTVGTVAAVHANLTRNTYRPFARVNRDGSVSGSAF